MARRPDGLYDFPEAGLVGVPEQFVPDHLREAPPPPPPPAQPVALDPLSMPVQQLPQQPMLAENAPPVVDSPQLRDLVRGAQPGNSPEARSMTDAMSAQQQLGQAPEAYADIANKLQRSGAAGVTVPRETAGGAQLQLNGPQGAAMGAEQPASNEANQAYAQYLQRAAMGSPGRVIPGGPQLAQETWTTNNVAARPGTTVVEMTDPETGMPVRRAVPNDVLYNAEKSKLTQAEDELESHLEASEKRKGGRELLVGQRGLEAATREDQYRQHLEQQLAQQEKQLADHDAKVQSLLDNLQRQAASEPPQPSLGRRFTLGIAQGLLYAGAAAAGQQVPHVDWIGQEIRNDIDKQKMQLDAGLHIAGLKLNALQQMRQHFTSPEAAEHALAAANWAQYQHEVEAYAHRAKGGEYSDNAQAMWNAADIKRQQEAAAAYAAEHNQVIANMPARTVGGAPGGWPGVVAAIKKMHAGEQPAVVQKYIDDAWKDFSENQPFTMRAPPEKHERAQVTFDQQKYGSRVQLDPEFTGHSGIAFISNDPKMAQQAIQTQAQARAAINILDDLDSLSSQIGHSISPTQKAKVINAAEALKGKVLSMAGEGMTEAKFESIERRLNLKAYENVSTVADLKKLTEQNRKDIIETARALIPTANMTRSFQGNDYLENLATKRKAE